MIKMIKVIKRFVTESKNQTRDAYIWNIIACTSNSFQTVILLIVFTQYSNLDHASFFTMGIAVANLFMMVGKYGVRNYQVSDVNCKYNYREYCFSRSVTTAAMVLCCVLYIIYGIKRNGFTYEKAMSISLICLMRVIDVVEDVIHGWFQQNKRMDIAVKIQGIRTVMYIAVLAVTYIIKKDLIFSLTFGLIISILISVTFNFSVYYMIDEKRYVIYKNIFKIIAECTPIAISTFVVMYLGNAPKYIIDSNVSTNVQSCFNIVFMPSMVITLLSNYVFLPIINKISHIWNDGDKKKFLVYTFRQILIIIFVTIFAIVFGHIIGLKLLGLIYNVKLEEYSSILKVLLVSGGFTAILNLLNIVLTITRRQSILMYVYIVGTAIMFLFGKKILLGYGILGLCVFHGICLFAAAVILYIFILYYCSKTEKEL